MKIKDVGRVIKSAVNEFINDDALTLAAAVAFYTVLSLAPLLLLAVWVIGLIYRGSAEEQAVVRVQDIAGPQAADVVRTILQNASDPRRGTIAALVGFGTFLFFASGVFAQLQWSLNRIWNVQVRPDAPWRDWFRQRFRTLVMMGIIALILLASVVASATLSVLRDRMESVLRFPVLWWSLNNILPLLIYILLFAMIYRILPDVDMPWRDVWWGAFFTALLFAVGKSLIGWYIGRGTTSSVYGAAGSLVALLTWLYYSAVIFFFGAELTQAIARQRGSRVRPNECAEWTDPGLATQKVSPAAQPPADTQR